MSGASAALNAAFNLMTYRRFLPGLLLALLCCTANTQESNAAYWLLMPLANRIAACAQLSPEMRTELDESLDIARQNAPKLVPPPAPQQNAVFGWKQSGRARSR